MLVVGVCIKSGVATPFITSITEVSLYPELGESDKNIAFLSAQRGIFTSC